MTNRFATLLLTATLGLAAAQTTPATSSVADTSLTNATVTIEIGRYAGPLSSLLAALAKSAGYGLILDTNVDALPQAAGTTAATGTSSTGTGATGTATADTARPVVYSFQNKPFNEVWPLLMDVYGLSYDVVTLAGQPVLRVSNTPIQRTVTLENADATQASQQVKLFFGTPTYSETPQKDAQGNTVGVTRTLVDVKLDSATLRIVPDVRSNAVIVRGTNKEVAEVTRLLAQLDSTPGAQAGSASTPETQTVQRVYTVKGAQADIVALLAAQYPGLKVTPVGQTGQLVVTGPQNQLDAALTLLGQVDKVSPTVQQAQTVQRIFQLVNASAEEVKATLLGQQETQASQTSASSSAFGQSATTTSTTVPGQAGAVTGTVPTTSTERTLATTSLLIVADKRTNTLIVRGTAEQVAQVADLIPQLDQKVPQINVQVRIQEITERASRALGVNWSAGFGGFSVSSSNTAGLGVSFDPTRSLLGFNLGASLNALQGQGLSKSVYDGSITMQSGQRSLGGSGDTQNASSTAAASIKSGGRLEVNIPSAAANVPAIQKQIDYGVNLDFFSPQVAPDGTITLRVRGQVNDLRTTIAANTIPNVLQFTNSEAQTTLTFKNGETLLLSGLLATKTTENKDGTPFLSSIPVVGSLFGKQSTSTEKTQLLVVITGTIVQ
ncbi:secretin N-terminal domain-containing protein [Deinococcus soli (ex Cha et al. 2016)]|uniref:General secretion pathway protein D/type IV pilus assembly protein PilQ n=2 Tax=Deinococcus soli (ex Cha et al. 2016) TaxID=1309411 RepID=A0AAE4BKK0_9DEIO|nr:secretin N-terminal domain-containing protein [Deinococcus soli (ex Cha et al. 2016)]MDR6217010.1 general secretion pathway protein D/type IV pilus assembly protein PilQ [Deinococcus soli (ex Cha et al. 2016)]MDR6327831.1 general secretion pathway protein D/type IV pilus assembly protein PilQ [Deinococcus soli (ex Cha et al. 2016)]MDR6750106.1 general secretion pathway protein D/type IV pilus assembly protein PilQ [Deinococcus soli (ex Cha et al. 2016)]